LDAVNGQTATADNAAYIGNTHTQVYHNASDINLPNEENRAYFATAEDAEAAGYRAAGQTTQV
jgi:methylphosphotriester-DNA--protein-cysteine methyltransferase